MRIRNPKDFLSGLLFMVAGVAFALGASRHALGSGAKMGPGLFPLVLALLLAALGLVIAARAFRASLVEKERLGAIAWRPLVCIVGANLIFGVMLGGVPALHLPPLGMLVGVYAMTFVACYADAQFSFKQAFGLATILALLSYGIFILLLKLPVPVWPYFLTT